jgi:hypothetical protein
VRNLVAGDLAATCAEKGLGGQNEKGPELGISGPALRGVGGGRGLAARDAVCVESIVTI